jgi:hypothetical protein
MPYRLPAVNQTISVTWWISLSLLLQVHARLTGPCRHETAQKPTLLMSNTCCLLLMSRSLSSTPTTWDEWTLQWCM